MPTIISGAGATAGTDAVVATRRKLEVRDEIFLLEPAAAPLTLFLNKVGRKAVGNPHYLWLEDERTPTHDRINSGGGHNSTVTTIVVDNQAYFAEQTLLRNQRTGEVCLVTAQQATAGQLTVVRSFGGTAAAGMNDNDSLTILGGAAPENAAAEAAQQTQKSTASNYTQIARDPFGASGTLISSDLYGGDYMGYEAKARGIEHATKIELALWFGEKAEDTTNVDLLQTVRRSCGGIDEVISTYSTDMGGALSLESLFDHAENAFYYGSNTKFLFCGRAVSSNISLLAGNALQVVPPVKTFGVAVERLVTPHGIWNIVSHKLFEGDEYSLRGYTVDMDALTYVYMRGRDTTLYTNIQANNVDGQVNEYMTEFGLERRQEKRHAVMTDAAV